MISYFLHFKIEKVKYFIDGKCYTHVCVSINVEIVCMFLWDFNGNSRGQEVDFFDKHEHESRSFALNGDLTSASIQGATWSLPS